MKLQDMRFIKLNRDKTPKEKLDIESCERTWEFLKNILKELKIKK